MYGEDRVDWNGTQFTAMPARTSMFASNGRVRECLGYPQYTRTGWDGEEHICSIIDYIVVDDDTLGGMTNSRRVVHEDVAA